MPAEYSDLFDLLISERQEKQPNWRVKALLLVMESLIVILERALWNGKYVRWNSPLSAACALPGKIWIS